MRTRALLTALLVLLLPLGVLAEDPKPITAPPADGTDLDGLLVRTELPSSEEAVDAPDAAKVSTLPDRRAARLLKQLPPLPAPDVAPSPLRPATAPPPITGEERSVPFPAPGEVAAPTQPEAGPLKVVRWGPEGDVDLQPQIRLTFSQPMIAVAGVDASVPVDGPARMEPPVPGRWRWIGTRTLVFEPDAPLARATTWTVTVPSGVESAVGGTLNKNHHHTFRTEGPRLVAVAPDGGVPAFRQPVVRLRFDLPVDPDEAKQRTRVVVDGKATPWPMALADETPGEEVALTPTRPFPLGAHVDVTVAAGLPPLQGDVPSGDDFTLGFDVHEELRIEEQRCSDWSCRAGSHLGVDFNNELAVDSFVAGSVKVDPPLTDQEIEVSWRQLWIRGVTEPGTYRVTVPGSIQDKFGQKLGRNKTLVFEVVADAPRYAQLEMPRGPVVVLDPDSAPIFPLLAVRFDRVIVRVHRLAPEDFADWSRFRDALDDHHRDGGKRPTSPGEELLSRVIRPDQLPAPHLTELDLAPLLEATGGVGHLGITVEAMAEDERVRWGAVWVQRTDLGLSSWSDGGQAVAWASSLRDGSAAEGVQVRAIDWDDGELVASAKADAHGQARLPLLEEDEQGRQVVLLAGDGPGAAVLPGYFGRRGDRRPQLRWFLFDDRGLYRPGEEIVFKGWVRQATQRATGVVELAVPADRTLKWTLRDPRYNEVASGEAELTARGGFDLTVELPPEVDLGQGRLEVDLPGEATIDNRRRTVGFRIEEFRRPRFEVSGSVAGGPHRVGGSADFEAVAAYFTGDPMPGSDVRWELTANDAWYAPPGHEGFSYGPREPWWKHEHRWGWHGGPTTTEVIEAKTDGEGRSLLRVRFDRVDPVEPRPMRLTAVATVQDLDRQTRSAMSGVLVHPSEVYVGVRSEARFVLPDEPFEVEALVVDADGAVVPGAAVEVTVEPEWVDVAGSDPAPVPGCSLRSGEEPVLCALAIPRGGLWRIRTRASDEAGRPTVSDLLLWVSGGSLPPSAASAMQQIRVEPDQELYAPGESAEILVTSPFWPAEGSWTVRKPDGVLSGHLAFDGPTAAFTVPVALDDAPNLPVQVLVVGSSTSEEAAGGPVERRPAWSSGQVRLNVRPVERILGVEVIPRDAILDPGAATRVDVQVVDHAGQPVPGTEVALWAVDEAVLSLAAYQLADPIDSFWSWRSNVNVPMEELRQRLLPPTDELLERWRQVAEDSAKSARGASGAPMMDMEAESMAEEPSPVEDGGEPKTALRSDFRALAVFEAAAVTNSAGEATVAFELPDNLTRYRVMAVAVDTRSRSGKGESSFTARRELMIRPAPPRFADVGDRFDLPVLVQNRGERTLDVELALRAAGLELTGAAGRRIRLPAGARTEVRLPVRATAPGTATVQVIGAAGKQTDAAQVEFPVWLPVTTEAFATYGELDAGVVVQPVSAPEGALSSWGGLEITTSSTALAALTDAVLYLTSYPFDCTEQVASRLLAVAALADVLAAFEADGLPSGPELERAVARDIATLASRQEWSGGFRLWSSSPRVDPWASVHAAHALQRASQAGWQVPKDALDKALRYLREIEQRSGEGELGRAQHTLLAYALYVRARLDDDPTARAMELVAEPGLTELPLEATALLASALLEADSEADVAPLLRHVENRAVESAATAEFADDYGEHHWRVYHSARRTDALALEALLRSTPDSDLVPKVVRGLQAHRVRGRWRSTQENAFVLLALERYFRTFEATDPDFVARIWLGGDYAGEQRFEGRSVDRTRLDVPMAALGEAPADLVLTHEGSGRLYYRVGMRYAPASFELDAADFGFAVTRRYEAVDDEADVRRDEDGTWIVRAGARVRVVLEQESGERRYHVALVDRLPAGFEPVPVGLAGVATAPGGDPWGPWWVEHRNLRDERAEAFTSLLRPGVHRWSYVVRATTPGEFIAPPPRAEEMYFPETFGRGATERVIVE